VEGRHIAGAAPAAAITPDGKVVLNLADETELQKLPGIGKSRARAIVEQRERLGRFRRLEDLLRVKGIGPRRLATLRTKLVLDPP
jgi:competence protein ComEA